MAHPIPTPPVGVDVGAWTRAVADVRGYCRWHIAPEVTETVTVDGPGGHLLTLPTQRLTDLAAVTSDGHPVSSPEWSASGLVRGGWSNRFRGVTVTMTHGYEEWPEELVGVIAELASSSVGLSNVKQVTSGSHQVTFEASLRPSQRNVLDRYRLVYLS